MSITTTSGNKPQRKFDCFRSVARFADDFEMIISRHDAPQALPHHGVVVHQKNEHS